jgi:hypothetical protein
MHAVVLELFHSYKWKTQKFRIITYASKKGEKIRKSIKQAVCVLPLYNSQALFSKPLQSVREDWRPFSNSRIFLSYFLLEKVRLYCYSLLVEERRRD